MKALILLLLLTASAVAAPLPMSYTPTLPALGEYSVPHVCRADISPDWPQVTLHENGNETLNAAFARLLAKSKANGVLNIKHDAPPLECDVLYSGKGLTGAFVLRGLPGPSGELPRMYCRSDFRDGNIPHAKVAGSFFATFGRSLTVIESLHIDGYKSAVKLPQFGRTILRNNYIHHQVGNGVSSSNVRTPNARIDYEFCGNEMSHSGRDNGQHTFYVHRGITPTTNVYATWVDNFFHSAASSSSIKSIANENTIVNNRLSKSVTTDPSFKVRSSQFLIDIPGCSQNVIDGNFIEGPKLQARAGGEDLVGIRNRKTELKGCDRPAYGSAQFNDPEFWSSLNDEPMFFTIISNNTFRTRPEGFDGVAYDAKLTAIHDFGVYPVDGPGFADRILLPTPKNWFDPHKTVVRGNTYVGPFKARYESSNETHCKTGKNIKGFGICPPYPTPGPAVPANHFRIEE